MGKHRSAHRTNRRLLAARADPSRDLLEILDDRYNRRSAIITSQIPVPDWHRHFNDPTIAEAVPRRELLVEVILYGERDEERARLYRAIAGTVDVDHIYALVARSKLTREGFDPMAVRACARR